MNGDTTKKVVLAFALAVDKDLHEYISTKMSFPNSMVDRITPATTDAVTEGMEVDHGIIDQWPVVAEPFLQWVIEVSF